MLTRPFEMLTRPSFDIHLYSVQRPAYSPLTTVEDTTVPMRYHIP